MRIPLLIWFLTIITLAQGQPSPYARVKIYGNQASIRKLDITLDHIHVKQGESITGVFSEFELNIIRKSGLRYEILEGDVTSDYLKNVKNRSFDRSVKNGCTGTPTISPLDTITVPQDFSLGTMGGFLKYEEMLAHLDNMAARYPNLVSVKKAIFNPQASADYQTHQGRPIYYVKISDHVASDESPEETQILYTALHHAREPASLSQLIFYMYYLLENYGKNNWVTHLVNNREMIFVPCVNPDGYIYNQTTNPNGGGMWRKNRRANAGGSFGVDLNRNYSYQWGVSGASSDPNSDVYKGPSPFSEPENKAIRSLCQQFNFTMAFNYHTHGDLLLFPFGYDNVQVPDHDRYTQLTGEMVEQNNFVNEQSVLLYPAAGDSDDYMYANTTDKPRIFAMTPEVGDDFWIPQSAIIPLCRETLWQNMSMALQADTYPLLKTSAESIDEFTGNLAFTVEARGLNALDDAQLAVSSQSDALAVGTSSGIGDVNPFQVKTVTVPYEVAAGTPNGTPLNITCRITFNSGKTIDYQFRMLWKGSDVISGQTIFEDDFITADKWVTSGSWAVTSTDFASGPSSITDSPGGSYNNYVNMKIDTRDVIDLGGAQTAYVTFKARWNIEADDDYLQLTVVKNNIEYPVCGNYSRVNPSGKIVYDGNQNTWVQEQVNLADFLGSEIRLRFRMKSDGATTSDGFYLDDLAVLVTPALDVQPPVLVSVYPEYNATASINGSITLTFSENIALHEGGIVLRRLNDHAEVAASVAVNGHTITLAPSSLEYATQYFVDVSPSAVYDLAGNYFAGMNQADWLFVTGAEPDTTPPQIETRVPLPGAIDVAEDQVISIVFDEPVFVSEGIKLTDNKSEEVPAEIHIENETTVLITPEQLLLPGMTYTVQIPAGSVEDGNHNSFEGLSSEWNFATIVITGIEKFTSAFYKAFPNPIRGAARMSLPDVQTLEQIQLINAVGGVMDISWRSIDRNLIELEIGKPRSGIYVLRLRDAAGLHTVKLLIE
jgi:hypothetical protein